MDELEKIRKRIRKESEELFEVDENSDIPIHERYVKEKNIKKIRKS